MALIYINARCKRMLNVLLTQSDYISVNRIAEVLNISRRTVYYDIEKLNIWLEQAQLSRLEVVHGKGLFLSHKEREQIQAMLNQDTKQPIYTLFIHQIPSIWNSLQNVWKSAAIQFLQT